MLRIITCAFLLFSCSCPDEQRINALEKKKADLSLELEKMQHQKLDSASGESQIDLVIEILEIEDEIDQTKKKSTCL